ncbi:MAG: hypothetical protein WBN22_04210, partial [Verrucomicrobiia bacterium]
MDLRRINFQDIFHRVVHDGHNLISPSRQENNQHDEDNHFPDCLKLGVPASMMRDGRGNQPAGDEQKSDRREQCFERQTLGQKIREHGIEVAHKVASHPNFYVLCGFFLFAFNRHL